MNRSQRILCAVVLSGLAAFVGAELGLRIRAAPGAQDSSAAAGRVGADAGRGNIGGSGALPGEPLPGLQSDPKIPAKLPNFSLQDLNGVRVSIERWHGKSLMLNFWATWCAPCRREIPLLQALHSHRAGEGMEVIGIAVDYPDKVRAYAREFGLTYPLLVGEQDALDLAADLGVATPAFPFTVFTDRRGAIVALYMGELKHPDVDHILEVIDQLNQDHVDLRTAQRQIAAQLSPHSARS